MLSLRRRDCKQMKQEILKNESGRAFLMLVSFTCSNSSSIFKCANSSSFSLFCCVLLLFLNSHCTHSNAEAYDMFHILHFLLWSSWCLWFTPYIYPHNEFLLIRNFIWNWEVHLLQRGSVFRKHMGTWHANMRKRFLYWISWTRLQNNCFWRTLANHAHIFMNECTLHISCSQ